jgi:ABC-type multidrug transport system ATPase subunit
MLSLSGIEKSFAGRAVLTGLALEVGAGESVALVGANGCGKTTTLGCIVGLVRPDGGRVLVGGVDVARDPCAARKWLSYLPQRPVFPLTLTVRETIAVVARLRGLATKAVDREIEACGLAGLADRNVGHLSGGERQRLAMAVAFLPPVDLYIFDEPSANLDPAASRLLFQRARQLKRDGHALLFTTHIPADVRHLATRVALLRGGRIESEANGQFELRRAERMLERDMWGIDHEDWSRDAAGDGDALDGRVQPQGARAGGAAGRSR